MDEHTRNGVLHLGFSSLASEKWLVHGFSTRRGGVSEGAWRSLNLGGAGGYDRASVAENRRRFLVALGIEPRPVAGPKQVHKADVLVVENGLECAEADAVVCARAGIPLMVLGADCPLVMLADTRIHALGLVHSGRRSTVLHIVRRAVAVMRERFGSRAGDIKAGISPAIGPDCYEVDELSAKPFMDAFGGRFARKGPIGEGVLLDLPGAIGAELVQEGVLSVERASECTHCNAERFYSYRRDGPPTGRMGLLGFILP